MNICLCGHTDLAHQDNNKECKMVDCKCTGYKEDK